MANISVTNTFANATTADATQVNQNFSDIINGTSDGTKDFSISALTVGGTLTANGNVNLGNASGDDLSITASLASSVAIKTTATYNVGSSTLGLLSVYLGNSTFTTRILSGASSSWSLTLPATAGTSRYRLETDGAGATSWAPVRRSSSDNQNISIAAAVAASALTITLKSADATDLSATNPADIVFRSSTSATGTATSRSVTSNLTLTVSSGSTLGTTNGNQHFLYLYAIDNSGTVELAVSQTLHSDFSIVSTTAEGGAGAADSNTTIYSTTARSNVSARVIGRLSTTQTTAGTWAAVPSEISLGNFAPRSGPIVARATRTTTQSMANNTLTKVEYATETYDSHGAFDNVTNYRFTSVRSGFFRVSARVAFVDTAITTGDYAELWLYKDGSQYCLLDWTEIEASVTTEIRLNGSDQVQLNAGQYVEIWIRQRFGAGAVNTTASGTQNNFSIEEI
jgi:hypothetical protein